MKVTVMYFASLREITGKKEELVDVKDGATIENLLHTLSEIYGPRFTDYVFEKKTGTPRDHFRFLVDGTNIMPLQSLKTKITGGSRFAIIPPVGGG